MAGELFGDILQRIAVYEGGYSNHPADKGGPTMCGVTQRVYDAFRRSRGLAPRSVRQLDGNEWQEIFRQQYWNVIRGDRLPRGVDLAVFDGAITSGSYQSGLWLQRALGKYYGGEIDGQIGERTLAALAAHPDHDGLIADMLARRLGMLRQLKNWPDFGNGWTARVSNVMAISQAWAMGSVGPDPIPVHEEGGDAKGYASDVTQPPVDATTATQGSVASGGGGVVLNTIREQLEPLSYSSPTIQNILIGLTVIAVLITIGGALYGLWASRKTKRARAAIEGGLVADVPVFEYEDMAMADFTGARA